MSYTVDKVNQLREARRRGRFGSVASLTNQGVTDEPTPAKKAAKKTVKKAAVAKKTVAKKTAKKS